MLRCPVPFVSLPRFFIPFMLLLATSLSQAATIEISSREDDESSRLELRNIVLPDGSEATLYVVQGNPVTVTIDDADTIVANYIEFDLENLLVRIIGEGSYSSANETISGSDFSIDLNDDSFDASDVVILTEAIDVVGVNASRIPGQLNVVDASFSPCSRCNQGEQDYSFEAKSLRLYPGNRLIAFDTTIFIKGIALMSLPVLVLPLGPKDKTPQLSIATGSATKRAESRLLWPYVYGDSAQGYVELRYFADVVPGNGNIFTDPLLGGHPIEHYFGLRVEHNYFTPNGEGIVDIDYSPSFVEYLGGTSGTPSGKTKEQIGLSFRYQSAELEALDPLEPSIAFHIFREDSRRESIGEYDMSFAYRLDAVDITLSSQSFIDFDEEDTIDTPSYDNINQALNKYVQVAVQPRLGASSFSLGPLQLNAWNIEASFLEDQSNPDNRSATLEETQSALKLLLSHDIALNYSLFEGNTIQASNTFAGSYYNSQNDDGELERLINWKTSFSIAQRVAEYAHFQASITREAIEGETPFSFDTQSLREGLRADGNISLTPFAWLRFTSRGSYTFSDSRNSDNIGFSVINSSLGLFENIDVIETFSLSNDYNPKIEDPGNLTADFGLRWSATPFTISVRLKHVSDLLLNEENVYRDPETGEEVQRDVSLSSLERISVSYDDFLELNMSKLSYLYDPEKTLVANSDVRDYEHNHWANPEFGLALGTSSNDDFIPRLSGSYVYDINHSESVSLKLNLKGNVYDYTYEVNQELNYSNNTSNNSYFQVTWPEVATFRLAGIDPLAPSIFGLELDENTTRSYDFSVNSISSNNGSSWKLRYSSKYDPSLNDGTGGFKDSSVNAEFSLVPFMWETPYGTVLFDAISSSTEIFLADDALSSNYIRKSSLKFGADIFGVVGLGFDLNYNASLDNTSSELGRSTLGINRVSLSTRIYEDFYVAMVLKDTWNFLQETPGASDSPFNFQPTFYAIWDRCCWALYSSWDTATGTFTISVSMPASSQGLTQEIPSEIRLPGRTTQVPEQTN